MVAPDLGGLDPSQPVITPSARPAHPHRNSEEPGIGPEWVRVGRSIRYPIQTVPGTITCPSEAPLGELGQVLPDPHSPWRVLVDAQRLEPADEGGEPAWLSTLRIASTDERNRALAGYRRLLDALRETPDGQAN